MPTTRKTLSRVPARRITRRALVMFRKMLDLETRCTCPPDAIDRCEACDQWWALNDKLCGELRLRPWEFPAYGNCEDTNRTGVLKRYLALKAASDASQRA